MSSEDIRYARRSETEAAFASVELIGWLAAVGRIELMVTLTQDKSRLVEQTGLSVQSSGLKHRQSDARLGTKGWGGSTSLQVSKGSASPSGEILPLCRPETNG
jgi:hypothetical protein